MGLDTNAVQFLIAAHKMGVRFGRTITLGRQNLNVFSGTVSAMLEREGVAAKKFQEAAKSCEYAEPLFEALGATQVDAVDNSDFEGAKFIHDLSEAIPPGWKEQFDAVYDGGTLEHVFNFPVALRNAMELLRPGGRLFIHTCANNLCGHGFYQFSPELFYRALSPENGFEIERVIIHRVGPYGRWHEVSDPEKIHERVELITFMPMHMFVQARRVKVVPIFTRAPQQSIYSSMWLAAHAPTAPVKTGWLRAWFPKLYVWLSPFKTGIEFYRRQSLFNRRYFKLVKK
jgi:SAM-dependent methyltransferase